MEVVLLVSLILGSLIGIQCQECGQTPIAPDLWGSHIVGGKEARPNSWPWQVSMGKGNDHSCGGSILAPNWILTAAHCFDDEVLKDFVVRIGFHHLYNMTGVEKVSKVTKIIIHEKYNEKENDEDIALMKIDDPIEFSDHAQPVCLPESGEGWNGDEMVSTGWGSLRNDGPESPTLQQITIKHIAHDVCNSKGWYNGEINGRTMLCAGLKEGGKDSCQGDSGGPLVVKQDKGYVLAGVTSWGEGCAKPQKPGIYAHVSEYTDWINNKMANN